MSLDAVLMAIVVGSLSFHPSFSHNQMKFEDYPKFVQGNYQYLREAYARGTLKSPLKDYYVTEMKRRVDPMVQRQDVNPMLNTVPYSYQVPERASPLPYPPEYPRPTPYTSYYQGPVPYYNPYQANDPRIYCQAPIPPMNYQIPQGHYQPIPNTVPESRPIQTYPAKPLSLKEKFELSGIVRKEVEDKAQTRDPRIKNRGNGS